MFSSLNRNIFLCGNKHVYIGHRCYKTLHPYINKKLSSQELADVLEKSAIYCGNGFVVLNKPQGISFAEEAPNEPNSDFEVSLNTLQPFLKKKFKCKELLNAKVPEKHASGVSVFCTDGDLLKKIKQCFRSMRGTGIYSETYECVVLGQPSHRKGGFEGGITLQSSPNGKQKRIKFIKECGKSMVRKGIVKPVKIEHSTLVEGELASLISISITRTKWHAVRVYTATELVAPILGDRVFGGLVRTVLGSPVLVDLFSPAAFQPKKLPKDLMSKLNLTSRDDIEIPLHLHLAKIQINNFPCKGNYLEFCAPQPEYFKWTCSALDLGSEENSDNCINQEEKLKFISK